MNGKDVLIRKLAERKFFEMNLKGSINNGERDSLNALNLKVAAVDTLWRELDNMCDEFFLNYEEFLIVLQAKINIALSNDYIHLHPIIDLLYDNEGCILHLDETVRGSS
jgi:hypothetical protein